MFDSKKTKNKTKILIFTAAISTVVFIMTACMLFYTLFVYDGTKWVSVTVPRLEGMKLSEIALPEGFRLEESFVYSSDVGEGVIISQSPSAGAGRKTEVDGEDLMIKVTVSAGVKKNILPKLCGYEVRQAKILLEEIGCAVKTVRIYSRGVQDGIVLSSFPDAQAEIKEGDTVTLFVSRSDFHNSVKVPDVCGLDRSQAARVILSSGLCVGDISEEESKVFADGQVISQFPEAGMLVRWGSRIDISTARCSEETEGGYAEDTEDTEDTEEKGEPRLLPWRREDQSEWTRKEEE